MGTKVDTHRAKRMCDKDEWLAFQILMGNQPPTEKYSRDWAEETVYRVGRSKAVLEAVSTLWQLNSENLEQMISATPFLKLFVREPTKHVKADVNNSGAIHVTIRSDFNTEKPE